MEGGREHRDAAGAREPQDCPERRQLGSGKEGTRRGLPGAFRRSMVLLTPWFQTPSLQSCEKVGVSFHGMHSVVMCDGSLGT